MRWVCNSCSVEFLDWPHRWVKKGNRPGPIAACRRRQCRLQSLTKLTHLAVPTPHPIHHGSRKDCTLRNRCNPSIYRSSWCQAFYRFHVRIASLSLRCPQPKETSFLFLFSLDTEYISNPTVRSWTERYLGFGETMFNTLQGAAVTSPYFKRSERQ